MQPAVHLYAQFLASNIVVKAEFELWKMRWTAKPKASVDCTVKRQPDIIKPSNALHALSVCNRQLFPNIYTLLHIAATLPVTTASAERTFSSMKLIKTYLRSTMTANRLTGLALLNIHRDIELTADEVIDNFALQNRRLDFVL